MEKNKMWYYKHHCFVTTPNGIMVTGGKEINGLFYSEDKGKTWIQTHINCG